MKNRVYNPSKDQQQCISTTIHEEKKKEQEPSGKLTPGKNLEALSLWFLVTSSTQNRLLSSGIWLATQAQGILSKTISSSPPAKLSSSATFSFLPISLSLKFKIPPCNSSPQLQRNPSL